MADTQTNHLGLYRIGAATDNVGIHMIEHYNANMTALDTFIAAHDIASISISSGTLTITATDGTTYTASIDAEDINYSNSESGLTATQIQAAIDEVVTALGGKQDALTEGDNITITGSVISATDTTDADGISFDNTDSGLTATDVQGAIDEVVTDLAEKQDALTEGDHIDITDDTVSVDTTDSIDHVSKTVTGDIISITDGGDGFPVENLTVDVDPVQDLNGYDHPWAGGGGRNFAKFDSSGESRTFSSRELTFTTQLDGSIVVNGTCVASSDGIPINVYNKNMQTNNQFSVLDKAIPNGTYLVSNGSDNPYVTVQIIGYNNESDSTGLGSASITPQTVTIDDTYAYNNIRILISRYANGRTFDNVVIRPFIRLSTDSDTTWEPYENICPITGWTETNITRADSYDNPTESNVYTIDWQPSAGTVYGGTLDVTTGVLTRNKRYVDLGTLSWEKGTGVSSSVIRFTSSVYDIKRPENLSVKANALSSAFKIITGVQSYNGSDYGIAVSANSSNIFVNGVQYENMTNEEFASAMSGIQFVYEPSNPRTYQLTPTEVTTLLGNNTLWADTGDSTLVYNTDTDDIIPTSEAVVDYVAPTKAVADSIKCTETTAGTYTLSATVDADGNITYAWS